MNNDLKLLCKQTKGRVVTFGLEEKYIKFLEKNKDIVTLDTLNSFSKNKKKLKGISKNIPIKKIRKYFKKKKIDTIFYQVDYMKPYLLQLPKEIICIGKKDLYLIGSKEEIENTLPKFERYTSCSKIDEYQDKSIAHFIITNVKNNKIKELIYYIIDITLNITDVLQDFLIN